MTERWWRLAAALRALVDKASRMGVAVQGNFQLLLMCDLSLAAEAAVLAFTACSRGQRGDKAVERSSCDH